MCDDGCSAVHVFFVDSNHCSVLRHMFNIIILPSENIVIVILTSCMVPSRYSMGGRFRVGTWPTQKIWRGVPYEV